MVTNLFPPDVLGGYELLAADVARGLRERGHSVEVLTTGTNRPDDPDWVVRSLRLVREFREPASLDRYRHARKAGGIRAATRAVGLRGYDAALVMSLRRLGLQPVRELALLGIPLVYCFNDDWLLAHRPAEASRIWKRAIWSMIEVGPFAARSWKGLQVERAVYVSAAIRNALSSGGAPVPAGVVCFQGVDTALFCPRPFRLIPDKPRLLYVGRVHPTKGIDHAIAALAELIHAGTAATLTIVGAGDSAEMTRLQNLAETQGVADAIGWRGFVPRTELATVYHEHDVFLFPSVWEEPAGLTYLEAMSCGVPVVGFARGGAGELLCHGENALVATDGAHMAKHILELIRSPSRARRMFAGGLKTVRTRASLDHYIEVIEHELAGASRKESA